MDTQTRPYVDSDALGFRDDDHFADCRARGVAYVHRYPGYRLQDPGVFVDITTVHSIYWWTPEILADMLRIAFDTRLASDRGFKIDLDTFTVDCSTDERSHELARKLAEVVNADIEARTSRH